ncbi:MAG: response regulator [Candidatus Riflebacteria bacterium]|nr:response regulator [Candidatus Riflebacteria bacterium]
MKNILIADDSATARMIIRRCLEIAGCSESCFLEAANGEEALAIIRKESIDLLVTDLNMPVMDGKRLLASIKASPKLNGIPVIVVTSLGNPAIEQELMSRGADKVVAKPVSPATMQQAIKTLSQKGFNLISGTSANHEEIIRRAVSQTFEEVAFEEIVLESICSNLPPESAQSMDQSSGYWARLAIIEPQFGELIIWVPATFIGRIVSSIHGMPPEEASEQLLTDTLAELLNTLAGRLMAQRVNAQFNLGLPLVGCGPIPEEATSASFCFARFLVGEEPVILTLPKAFCEGCASTTPIRE